MASKTLNVKLTGDDSNLKKSFSSAGVSAKKLRGEIEKTGKSQRTASKETDKFSKSTQGLGHSLWSAAKFAAGAAAAYVGISQAKAAISTTEELAKATISLHENLGLSIKQSSEWAAVAQTRGADTAKLGMAFKTLAGQVQSAKEGSQSAVKEFVKLGFSGRDIKRSTEDTNFLLLKTSDGLHNMAAGADKAVVSAKLFGKGWQTIAPVLRDGSEKMQEQLGLANKYGATFGGKSLKSIQDLIGAQRELKFAQLGLQVTFTEKVAPALIKVGLGFAHLVNQVRRGKDITPKIVGIFNQVAEKAAEKGPTVAIAFVKGFLNAPIWAKLATATLLVGKFGGLGAFKKMGSGAGKVWASAFIVAVVGAELVKRVREFVNPPKLDDSQREKFAETLKGYFNVDTSKFIGVGQIRIATALGKILFNAKTEKVVAVSNKRLADLVGKDPAMFITQFNKLAQLRTSLRQNLAPLPGIAGQAGDRMKKALLPRLDSLTNQGGDKADAFASRVGRSFSNLTEHSGAAMQTIALNVQGLLKAFNVGNVPKFNVHKLLGMLPQLPR
jgi:hypothetical protein